MHNFKLTFSHRHSSLTSGRKVWYVDERPPYTSRPTTQERFQAAERYAERINGRVGRYFDTPIVILED